MKFPLFASLIIFCIWIAYEAKKSGRSYRKNEKKFWDREEEANATRRKSLTDLEYISIPLTFLTIPSDASEEFVAKHELLEKLAKTKIVNLTGYSNTDLKLMYGAPNLPLLMEYDDRFTSLVSTIQEMARELVLKNHYDLAKTYLEFAIDINTDVSQSYYLLADVYNRTGEEDRVSYLCEKAEGLSSILKNSIVQTLQEEGPYSDLLRTL